ncbi:hypothetical protein D3C77_165090 [compost metagenome]
MKERRDSCGWMVSSKVEHPGSQGTRGAGEKDRRLEPLEAPSETDFNIQRQTLIFTISWIASCDGYSTVTDLARLRGWSTSVPLSTAT